MQQQTAVTLRQALGNAALPFSEQEPLAPHTTFRIGGAARFWLTPKNTAQLREMLALCRAHGVRRYLLGNGSNTLFSDEGFDGAVIDLRGIDAPAVCETQPDGTAVLTVSAGSTLGRLCAEAQSRGLTGLEFACGIPGTVGGAVYMNAGAYDGEMAKVVTSVRVMDREGKISELKASELAFAYRHTALQNSGLIVTSVTCVLQPDEADAIAAKMADFSQRRISKQPLELPSAGSMFKRPPGYFAGTLIDQTGLKGYTVGGAQVSTKHAGFVVNVGGATAQDVLQLISDVQSKVFAAHGVRLEPEVLVLGEE